MGESIDEYREKII